METFVYQYVIPLYVCRKKHVVYLYRKKELCIVFFHFLFVFFHLTIMKPSMKVFLMYINFLHQCSSSLVERRPAECFNVFSFTKMSLIKLDKQSLIPFTENRFYCIFIIRIICHFRPVDSTLISSQCLADLVGVIVVIVSFLDIFSFTFINIEKQI